MKLFKKTIKIYIGVNKDNSISLHTETPVKDEERGIWVSRYPFCNSLMYNELSKMITKSALSWESEAELIEVNI